MQPRREFLDRLSKAALALGANIFEGVEIEGSVFRNERLGLTVRKPNRWIYDSIADFSALRDRQALLDASAGEDHPLRDPKNLPVLLVTDPRHRRGNFAPAIGLYDEEIEDKPENEEAGHLDMLFGFMESYAEMEILLTPYEKALRGATATFSEWTYKHQLDSGEEHELWVRSILVFRRRRAHTFHLVDSLKKRRISEQVWDRFVNSINYTRI